MTESSLLLFGSISCVFFTAFFTSAETALISSDKSFLSKKRKEGNKSASLAIKNLENLDYFLSTTQFGSNLSIASSTTLATLYFKHILPENDWWAFTLFTLATLILGDSLAKVTGRIYAEKISLLSSLPIYVFYSVFHPILFLISVYTNKVSKFLGIDKQDSLSRRKKTREELQSLLSESDNETDIRLGHKRIIKKVLEFSQQNVKKIMLPLVNVDAIEKNSSIQEAIHIFETLRHSRLPVYEERVDNIIGVLYFPDVFRCKNPEQELVSQYMRSAHYVPEIQQLEALTKEMQENEIAIVVDEYGGAVGIVTKEDILEEMVGNISDEWDENDLGIMEITSTTYLVHVKTEINELNERLHIHVPKGEYETLSGFLLQQFNRIPAVGDELYFGNFKVKVHRASERAIETVIIEVHRPKEDETNE